MITTVGKAKIKVCPVRPANCIGPDCMAWNFWIPPPGVSVEKKPHGMRDTDKKGYCGLTHKP